jgi:hypothetical protein
MFRALRYALAMGAAATLMGCSLGGSFTPQALGSHEVDSAQLASFAARAEYPSDARPSDGLRVGALVSRDGRTIQLENLSDEPMSGVNVWINRSFVLEVDNLPGHSTKTLHTGNY